jgi:hypothetical protein
VVEPLAAAGAGERRQGSGGRAAQTFVPSEKRFQCLSLATDVVMRDDVTNHTRPFSIRCNTRSPSFALASYPANSGFGYPFNRTIQAMLLRLRQGHGRDSIYSAPRIAFTRSADSHRSVKWFSGEALRPAARSADSSDTRCSPRPCATAN